MKSEFNPLNKSVFCGLFLLLCTCPLFTLASHNLGTSMSMECIGTCTVRVHIDVFRDCSAGTGGFPPAPTVNSLHPSCLGLNLLSSSNSVPVEITPVCPSVSTFCSGGTAINGIEYIRYSRDYSYCSDPATCSYQFSFAECCRTGAVTSVANAMTTAIYVDGPTLDVGLGACNNSPVWSTPRGMYIHQSITSVLALGASDPDGDSLVYSLIPCKTSSAGTVSYNTGYSHLEPLGPNWNCNLDANTGAFVMQAFPGGPAAGPVCVQMDEYRNGVLLSSQSREVMVFSVNAPTNAPPQLGPVQLVGGGSIAPSGAFETCVGSTLTLTMSASDPNPGQLVSMIYEGGSQATFAQTGNPSVTDTITGTNPAGTFTFTPTSPGSYDFKIFIQDDNCPILGVYEYPFRVRVGISGQANAVPLNCITAQFSAQGCGTPPFTYDWSGSGGLTGTTPFFNHTYSSTGVYNWQCVITDGNLNTDTVTGTIDLNTPLTLPVISGPDTVDLCLPGSVTLVGIPGMVTYLWSTAATSQAITTSVPGTYELEVIDTAGCSYRDTVVVNTQPPQYTPGLITSNIDTIDPCNGDLFANLGTGLSTFTHAWSDGSTGTVLSVNSGGSYSVTVTDGQGCQSFDTIVMPFKPADIYGLAQTSFGLPYQGQLIYLIEHDTVAGTLTAVDSTGTGTIGYYAFCNVNSSSVYYVKIAPDSLFYPNELPTYALSSLSWASALPLDPVVSGPVEVNFNSIFGSNPGGPGFIGGLISQGANKTDGPGDPVEGVRLYLVNVGLQQVIGYVDSDANGYFSIGNLPLGNYQVIPDVANVTDVNVPVVPLDANNPQRDSLDFRLHSTYLEWVTPTATTPPQSEFIVSLLPNPVLGTARILLELDAPAMVRAEIIDVQGRRLEQLLETEMEGGQHQMVWSPKVAPGIYFLKLTAGDRISIQKVVVLDAR